MPDNTRLADAVRRAWRTFWYGPVCSACHKRHRETLPAITLCELRMAAKRPRRGVKP